MKDHPRIKRFFRIPLFSLVALPYVAVADSLNVELGAEYQYFSKKLNAELPNAYQSNADVNLRFKYDRQFGDWTLLTDLYANADQQDDHRSRVDAKALALTYSTTEFDVTVGALTEFWGVAESRHLVDVINQTVVADNIDEESKLGQPMLKTQLHEQWGNVQFYVMPLFRERIYASEEGRLRPLVPILSSARYESSTEKKHTDFAARYTNTVDSWDLGVSYFQGTARAPLLMPEIVQQHVYLRPYYQQMAQTGIDIQHTSDSLLLKAEAIHRHNHAEKDYYSSVLGFEYTQVGVFNSAIDLGYLVEHLYDSRGTKATTPFAQDAFVGLRLVTNDVAQTTYLLGSYIDLDSKNKAYRFEMSTRLRDGLTLSVEGQAFSKQNPTELLYSFQKDDYVTLGLKWYF